MGERLATLKGELHYAEAVVALRVAHAGASA